MSEESKYDMSFEDIQQAIMNNLPMYSHLTSSPTTHNTQSQSKFLQPFVRPPPDKLFKLSEEDELAFENLRQKLGFAGDTPESETQTRSCNNEPSNTNSTPRTKVALAHRTIKLDTVCNQNKQDSNFDKYFVEKTILKHHAGPIATELDAFLKNYHVPQEKLDAVFDAVGDESPVFNNTDDSEILNYLKRTAENYGSDKQRNSNLDEPKLLGETYRNICIAGKGASVIPCAERKTITCDLRNVTNSLSSVQIDRNPIEDRYSSTSEDSDESDGSHTLWFESYRAKRRIERQTEECTNLPIVDSNQNHGISKIEPHDPVHELCSRELYTQRRQRFLHELFQATSLNEVTDFLLHEDVSFGPIIPLLEDSFHPSSSKQCVLMKFKPFPVRLEEVSNVLDYPITCYATISWLLSLIVPEACSEVRPPIRTRGLFINMDCDAPSSEEPNKSLSSTLYGLFEVDSSCEPHETLEKSFLEQVNLLKSEKMIWKGQRVHLPTISGLSSLIGYHLDVASTQELNLFSHDVKCSQVCGRYGTNPSASSERPKQSNVSVAEQLLLPISESERATVCVEIELNESLQKEIFINTFFMLLGCYWNNLDLESVRVGWRANSPVVAIAFRGNRPWLRVEQVFNWLGNNIKNWISRHSVNRASQYKDVNRKYLSYWFGARLPDLGALTPIQLARLKHACQSDLSKPTNCWLSHEQPIEILLVLPTSISTNFEADLIEAATDSCGYELIMAGKVSHLDLDQLVNKETVCLQYTFENGSFKCGIQIEKTSLIHGSSNGDWKSIIILRREHAVGNLSRIFSNLLQMSSQQNANGHSDDSWNVVLMDCNENLKRRILALQYTKPMRADPVRQESACELANFACVYIDSRSSLEKSSESLLITTLKSISRLNAKRTRSMLPAFKILCFKWIPVVNGDEHLADCLRFEHDTNDRHIECDEDPDDVMNYIGVVLIHGRNVEKIRSAFKNQPWTTVLTSEKQNLFYILQCFFSRELMRHPSDSTHEDSTTNDQLKGKESNLEHHLGALNETLNKEWQTESVLLTWTWPREPSGCVWLEQMVFFMHVLLTEEFEVNQILTSSDGKTRVLVRRPNAKNRMQYLNRRLCDAAGRSEEYWSRHQLRQSHWDDDSSTEDECASWYIDYPREKWPNPKFEDSDKLEQISLNMTTHSPVQPLLVEVFDDLLGTWTHVRRGLNFVMYHHKHQLTDSQGLKDAEIRLQLLKLFKKHGFSVCVMIFGEMDKKSIESLKTLRPMNFYESQLTERGFYDLFVVVQTTKFDSLLEMIRSEFETSTANRDIRQNVYITTDCEIEETLPSISEYILPNCRIQT